MEYFKRSTILLLVFLILAQVIDCTTSPLKIGIVQNYPATQCSNTVQPTGFEVEFFIYAMQQQGYTKGVDYSLICIVDNTQLSQIKDGTFKTSDYVGVLGGYEINSTFLDLGYQFSQPTISSGLSIVQKQGKSPNLLIKSFTWGAIIALICSIGLISIMLFNFETKNMFFNDYVFHTSASFFNIRDQRMQGLAGRTVQVALWFFGLVLMYYFYANQVLVIREQKSLDIHYTDQLIAENITADSRFESIIYDLSALYFPGQWPEDIVQKEKFILEKDVKLSLMESYKAYYLAYNNCNLKQIIKGITQIKYGMLFTQKITTEQQKQFNIAILKGQQKKNSELFLDAFLNSQSKGCEEQVNYLRGDVVTFDDLYRGFLLVLGGIVIALIWIGIKYKAKQKYQKLFFLFETNWVRRRRDLYTSKRLRKQWGKGMAEVLVNINKERSFRMKGINMLHQFIRHDRKYELEKIKEAFDEIYDSDEENNYKLWARKFNSEQFKLPYQQTGQQAQLKLQQSMMMQSSIKQGGLQSEMVPLEDMGRVTPLIEYFTQMVAPWINKKKKKQPGFQGNQKEDAQQMYSNFKKKQQENKKNQQGEGNKLFQDILGSGEKNESPNKDKSTDNMMNNRFNVNLLKLRKDYEKFIPKKDGQNSNENSRDNSGLKKISPLKDENIPQSSKRGFLQDSAENKKNIKSQIKKDETKVKDFLEFSKDFQNNDPDDDDFQMKEYNLRTDNSDIALKNKNNLKLASTAKKLPEIKKDQLSNNSRLEFEDFGSGQKASQNKMDLLKQKYLQEKKQNKDNSFQNSSMDKKMGFKDNSLEDIQIFKNQIGKQAFEIQKQDLKPINFEPKVIIKKQQTKKIEDIDSDDDKKKVGKNFDENLRQSKNNFFQGNNNALQKKGQAPAQKNQNEIIGLSDDDDSILGDSPKNQKSNQKQPSKLQQQLSSLRNNNSQLNQSQLQNSSVLNKTPIQNKNLQPNQSNQQKKGQIQDDVISLESESDF